jgi:hypothetical protein
LASNSAAFGPAIFSSRLARKYHGRQLSGWLEIAFV